MNIRETLENEILPFVRRPARYIGGEINAAGDGDAEVRLLLSYPDVYEVGMSNLGLQILYDIVNRIGWAKAERAFAVWPDMEKLMREKDVPLFSLETITPAGEFDIWGFSLQAELTYTNILTMLDLGRLPLSARERSWPGCPLVIGGGAGAINPEPLAEFFDLFLAGDGEEGLPEILAAFQKFRASVLPGPPPSSPQGENGRAVKLELLKALVKEVPGLYAPALYRAEYGDSGRFKSIRPVSPDLPRRIGKRTLEDLNRSRIERPLIPLSRVVHDRKVVEIMRGCKRSCRFCQAGWTGRPAREKDKEEVTSQALHLVEASGCREISLLSLSSGDYRRIETLMMNLSSVLSRRRVSLALPSLNAASVSDRILREISRVRKSGITLAPEAGSPRLRRVINKKLRPGVLERIGEGLKKMGWRLLKLYFMIGLPTEEERDIEAIVETINRVAGWGGDLNVTVSNFIPKAGTPFQWSPQAGIEEIREKQKIIRRGVKSGRVRLKFRPPVMSRIEGILARGDRRLSELLRAAWEAGCRFDDWGECFQPELWEIALEKSSLSPDFYLNPPYAYRDQLPWSHIESGIGAEILIRESKKALDNG